MEREAAWIGDAALALFARQFVLRERNAMDECTQQRELRRGPAVAVGVLGAAMLATGVVLVIRSRGDAESGPEVSARVSPTSASLRVAF